MAKSQIHTQAKRSWWSGRVTALCGVTAESGEWRKVWFSSGPTCPTCKKLKRQSKNH